MASARPQNAQAYLNSPIHVALRKCRKGLLYAAFFSLFANILMLTVSVYMMQVFDRVLTSKSMETLVFLTMIALAALLLMSLMDVIRGQVLLRLGGWLERELAPDAYGYAVEATLNQRPYRTEGLRDLSQVTSYLSSGGMTALFDMPWVPIYLFVIYMLHPVLGHIALAGVVVLVVLAVVNERMTGHMLTKAAMGNSRTQQNVQAAVRNAEVIDAMGMLGAMKSRWLDDTQNVRETARIAGIRSGSFTGISKFARQVLQVAALGGGAYLAVKNEISPGAMIAGSIIVGRALAPIDQAIGGWKSAVSALTALKRLAAFLSTPVMRAAGLSLPAPRGQIQVENLSYVASGSKVPLLQGIQFLLPAGEALAIIGPSGAGKSTLARLLTGLYPPTHGTARLDGAEIFKWNREELGPHMGYLPQDTELFNATVHENIDRMRGGTSEDIIAAAQMAGAHDMILRLPHGYDTVIGDMGVRISGGQSQRIALARALYGDVRLVILDEPNASLDAHGDIALAGAIEQLKKRGVTVVVIGHRLSVLPMMDKLLVLADGRQDVFGPRDDVLNYLQKRSQSQSETPVENGDG